MAYKPQKFLLASINCNIPILNQQIHFSEKRSVGFTKLPKGPKQGGGPDLRKYNLAFRGNSDTLYTARKCNFFAFMYTFPNLTLFFLNITLFVLRKK